jgi:thiamine-monophosphate kinase
MKLTRLGEFGLIEKLRRIAPTSPNVRIGIGDDAAWTKLKTGSVLITADLLLENVHFNLDWTSSFDLGYKALAVNLSDIAAMGGIPAFLILSLGVPSHFDSSQLEKLYQGIRSLALKHNVALVGGDISLAETLLISPCLIGHAPYRPISRSGAKIDQDIYVTGTLGDSALGLRLLKAKPRRVSKSIAAHLLLRHRKPTPRLAVGELLAREKLATAMIDISDGLLQDLGHICKASKVGALISEENLPLSIAYRRLAGRNGRQYALTGGEDYELLFCARRRDRKRVEQLQRRVKVPISRIGACVAAQEGIVVLDCSGNAVSFRGKGHDHFKKETPLTRWMTTAL